MGDRQTSEFHAHTVVELPMEWQTAPIVSAESFKMYRFEDDGELMHLGGGILGDGTNFFVLTYPGGARLARQSPLTDWALEERYQGAMPRPQHREAVIEIWRQVTAELADSGREMRDARATRTSAELAAMALPTALDLLTAAVQQVVAHPLTEPEDQDPHVAALHLAVSGALRCGASRVQIADALRAGGNDQPPEVQQLFATIAAGFLTNTEGVEPDAG